MLHLKFSPCLFSAGLKRCPVKSQCIIRLCYDLAELSLHCWKAINSFSVKSETWLVHNPFPENVSSGFTCSVRVEAAVCGIGSLAAAARHLIQTRSKPEASSSSGLSCPICLRGLKQNVPSAKPYFQNVVKFVRYSLILWSSNCLRGVWTINVYWVEHWTT